MFPSSACVQPQLLNAERYSLPIDIYREYLKGKFNCTIDLLFDWFGLVCFANENKNCQ
jgi:hypothetical protein